MKGLLVLLALVLTACAAGNAPAAPPLVGSEWVLKAMPGWAMQQAPQIPTLYFQSDTQVGGRSGCNSWGGGYELKGTTIRFGQMRSTLKACAYGMDVEPRFHEVLRRARLLNVEGDLLTLADDAGSTLATFFRASKAVPP